MQEKVITQNDKLKVISALHELLQLKIITITDKNNILQMLKDNDLRNINIFARRLLDVEQECYSDMIKKLII